MKITLMEPAIVEGPYCWLIDMDGLRVGVNAQTGWCVRSANADIELDAEEKLVPLGPLLELPVATVTAFLDRAAQAHAAHANAIRAFPMQALLKHVFHTSFSGYWPERALAWMADDPACWPAFAEELKRFSENKAMPQAARQQAARMTRAAAGGAAAWA
jgi:hypothetical protein